MLSRLSDGTQALGVYGKSLFLIWVLRSRGGWGGGEVLRDLSVPLSPKSTPQSDRGVTWAPSPLLNRQFLGLIVAVLCCLVCPRTQDAVLTHAALQEIGLVRIVLMGVLSSLFSLTSPLVRIENSAFDDAPFSWKFLTLHRCVTNFLGFAGVSLHHVNFPQEFVGFSWI